MNITAPKGYTSFSAEDKFSRVIEASPTALVLVCQDGLIELVNMQAAHMFGYRQEELLGKPLELLLPDRFRSRHVILRQEFHAANFTRIMGEGRRLLGLSKDGAEIPLEIGLNPIDLDGEQKVLADIVDITARIEMEQEQERQRRELERSNADLEEFAYAISHDLKAPLRAIAHLAQWISEDAALTAKQETIDNLKLLQGRVDRLQMLMDGLLAYACVWRDADMVQSVDIAEVVHDVVHMLSPSPRFIITCEEPMPTLRTERAPLVTIFQNLIGNALKHHDRDEGRVTVSARLVDGAYEFRVSDDGPGISPKFHERIFLIFQTLASRDHVESSGIGLALVKKRIESRGDRVWVESAPPARGSTFVFTWKEALS